MSDHCIAIFRGGLRACKTTPRRQMARHSLLQRLRRRPLHFRIPLPHWGPFHSPTSLRPKLSLRIAELGCRSGCLVPIVAFPSGRHSFPPYPHLSEGRKKASFPAPLLVWLFYFLIFPSNLCFLPCYHLRLIIYAPSPFI